MGDGDPAGDGHDDAMAESCIATRECELLDRRSFHNQAQARMALEFVEGSYPPRRPMLRVTTARTTSSHPISRSDSSTNEDRATGKKRDSYCTLPGRVGYRSSSGANSFRARR